MSRRNVNRSPVEDRVVGRLNAEDLRRVLDGFDQRRKLIIAGLFIGIPRAEIARRFGISPQYLWKIGYEAMSRLRSFYYGEFYFNGFDDRCSEVLLSIIREDRDLGRIAQSLMVAGSPCCENCFRPISHRSSGRPRKYCTPACRQASYRARHLLKSPE